MIKYSNFFVLGHGWATKYYWFDIVDKVDQKTPPFESLIKKNKLTFSIQKGNVAGDIHGSTMAINFFSEKFINLLKENHIKSYKTYPIKFNSKYNIPMKYYYIELTSKPVSEIEEMGKKKCSIVEGKKMRIGQKGLYFNLSEWDGSDIFGIKNTRLIIITKKLKELIEKAKPKNFVFENVEDFNWGVYE